MERIALFVVLVAAAVVVAWVLQRRRPEAPTRGSSWAVPTQIDRADFVEPGVPWLVAVFSSATCLSCQGTWEKASALRCGAVVVQQVDSVEHKVLHDRYGVEAVPMVLISDAAGVVRGSFLGEPTATDLWATVAELREPGSTPAACDHGQG